MAGFSLGGGHNHQHPHNEIPSESLFLYRNEEISPYNTNKGLQLWHQQQQQELQQDIFSSGMTPGGPSRRTNASDELPSRVSPVSIMMRQGSGGGISCQDCGNQAKKDCVHLRCRTCCKSRGFQCQTHLKSTWVPASRRRERQQQLAAASMQHQQQQQQQHKRPRENSAAAVAGHLACTRLPAAAAGLEVGNFPAEVNTPAVFRCVRVSSMDDGDQDLQYAYQAAVNIRGHVFKGILYDQGPDNPHYGPGESSSGGGGDCGGGGGGSEISRSLITVTTASTANTNTVTTSTAAAAAAAALLDPSSLYPVPFNAFMAGTQFFPHPRS